MIRFCNLCGAEISFVIPPGDSIERHVCIACGHIQYQNPKLIVGCVAEWENRILLCRRAIEPRIGYWTLPAGFMENGETTAEASQRETMEEAGADVKIDAPFALINIAHIHQVHLFYRARMLAPNHEAGIESLEVGLFFPQDIPWDDIAFPSVTHCLRRYLEDKQHNSFGFHTQDLTANHLDFVIAQI